MEITQIIHFNSQPVEENTIQQTVKAIREIKRPQNFTLGTQIQDKTAVQITAEWGGPEHENFKTTPEFKNFTDTLSIIYGQPHRIFHVDLNNPAFGPQGPGTANVVEYVQNYFPASLVTPEFQKKIEAEFLKFEAICIKSSTGDVGCASGWVKEELEHEDIKGEKAKCFLVMRGWGKMGDFERLVQSEDFRKAIPILLAWNVPYKMVSPRLCGDYKTWWLISSSGMLSVKLLMARS